MWQALRLNQRYLSYPTTQGYPLTLGNVRAKRLTQRWILALTNVSINIRSSVASGPEEVSWVRPRGR